MNICYERQRNRRFSLASLKDREDLHLAACIKITTRLSTGLAVFCAIFAITPLSAFASTPATPTISPAGGTYTSGKTVTISDSTTGAAIYYTTDGSTPTTASSVYSSSISIPNSPITETIRAIAVASGVSSASASASYTIAPVLASPSFSPAPNSYWSMQSVTLSGSVSGSVIYYTTDGSTPTTSSAVYSAPIALAAGKTVVTAMAVGPAGYTNSTPLAATYTIVPATPWITLASGTYTTAKTVSITDSIPGVTIYYTTDGSTPTSSSPVYTGPITIPANPMTETLRTFAGAGTVYGTAASATYTMVPTLPTPTASLPGANYTGPITVTLSDSVPGTTIYYTLDNSTPTTSSPQYSGPLQFSQNINLRTMAVENGYTASAVLHNVYAFVVPTPVITPTSGTYTTEQILTISESLSGAVVNYTTDGSTPTTSSLLYTGPVAFATTGTQTIKAIATSSGYQASAVSSSTFTLNLPSGVIANTVIGAGASEPIATNFMGFSHEWGAAQSMMGTAATGLNPIYQTLASNLSMNMKGPLVLRIGGDSTDSSGTATPATVEPFVELAENLNVNFILGVNLGSNNLSLAQEQATTFISSMPSTALLGLEIGNEPDGYSTNGLRSSTHAYTDFLSQYQQWSKGVAGPNTPGIVGPVFGTGNWITSAQPDVTGSALTAGIFTQHKYVACYNANSPFPANYLLQPSSSTGSLYLFQPYAVAVHQAGSLFRMGEMNSICNGGQAGVSNTFSSALWAIDTMFEYASVGIDGVNWNTNYTGGPYDLFQFNIYNKNGMNNFSLTAVRPLYYGLLFFTEAAGNTTQLLPALTLTNNNIKVWVTTDSAGNAHLVIINKETSTSGTVRITLPGYSKGSVVRLTASSYQATSGVTIGGQTYDGSPDGTLQGTPVTETTSPNAGVWDISVAASSAVLVNLQP